MSYDPVKDTDTNPRNPVTPAPHLKLLWKICHRCGFQAPMNLLDDGTPDFGNNKQKVLRDDGSLLFESDSSLQALFEMALRDYLSDEERDEMNALLKTEPYASMEGK